MILPKKRLTQNCFRNHKTTFGNYERSFAGLQIILIAFWDYTDNNETVVIANQGFIKKVERVYLNQIEPAVRLNDKYFDNKLKKYSYGN